MDICSQKNHLPKSIVGMTASRRNEKKKYQKPGTYSTPLCSSTPNSTIFYENTNPNAQETINGMCVVNNGCTTNSSYTYLNQRGVAQSPWFVQSKQNKNEVISTKMDARLVDPARNNIQNLDIKPIQVYYDLIHDNISHNPNLKDYGKNYKDYSSVTGGQIQYYVDSQESEPFYSPVYAAKTKSIGYSWTDPMGAVKPQFEKEYPLKTSFTGLSWLDDSCSHRDDITALQQRKNNEQKYELVYGRL
jgi:hypothetical protein